MTGRPGAGGPTSRPPEEPGEAGASSAADGAGENGEPIGPFPTWKALYATVFAWWAFMIIVLYVFTLVLDRGVP